MAEQLLAGVSEQRAPHAIGALDAQREDVRRRMGRPFDELREVHDVCRGQLVSARYRFRLRRSRRMRQQCSRKGDDEDCGEPSHDQKLRVTRTRTPRGTSV